MTAAEQILFRAMEYVDRQVQDAAPLDRLRLHARVQAALLSARACVAANTAEMPGAEGETARVGQ